MLSEGLAGPSTGPGRAEDVGGCWQRLEPLVHLQKEGEDKLIVGDWRSSLPPERKARLDMSGSRFLAGQGCRSIGTAASTDPLPSSLAGNWAPVPGAQHGMLDDDPERRPALSRTGAGELTIHAAETSPLAFESEMQFGSQDLE